MSDDEANCEWHALVLASNDGVDVWLSPDDDARAELHHGYGRSALEAADDLRIKRLSGVKAEAEA